MQILSSIEGSEIQLYGFRSYMASTHKGATIKKEFLALDLDRRKAVHILRLSPLQRFMSKYTLLSTKQNIHNKQTKLPGGHATGW